MGISQERGEHKGQFRQTLSQLGKSWEHLKSFQSLQWVVQVCSEIICSLKAEGTGGTVPLIPSGAGLNPDPSRIGEQQQSRALAQCQALVTDRDTLGRGQH